MPFQTVVADLLKTLNPAAASSRASYSRERRPWTPGYRAKLAASAAGLLAGVNAYHPKDHTKVVRMAGAGAANAATAFTYTLPSGVAFNLPTTADITEAGNYLNCLCLIYPGSAREEATLLERVATGAVDPTRAMFQVVTATTFQIASNYTGGNYVDVPKGWMIEIQVPAAADIVTLYDAATPDVINVRDFMAAGGAGKTGVLSLDRVFM